MPLASAAASFEVRSHLGTHDNLLLLRVGAQNRQIQRVDKCGVRQAVLQLLFGQRRIAHGITTSLPNTCRPSRRAKA